MEYQHIRTDLADRILTITLNRPDRLNAFTLRMKDELVHALGAASRDNDVRVIIVTGAGRAFCAGMEMEPEGGGNLFGYDEVSGEQPPVETIRDSGGEVSLAIFQCRKPVIGALNGAAVGVGITMTLAMDFRLAREGAKIGFVFARRGVTPEACSTWFLPRAVGMQKALEWVYSGEIFRAEEGLEAGLLRSVHGAEELLPAARALAYKLQEGTSPVSVALARQMLWRNPAFDHPIQAHAVESRLIYRSSEFWDGRDGFQSFLEKREPVFDTDLNEVPEQFSFWPEPPLR